jgi:hypothetical protein
MRVQVAPMINSERRSSKPGAWAWARRSAAFTPLHLPPSFSRSRTNGAMNMEAA